MPALSEPENWLYLGQGGTGKSTLLRHHLKGRSRVVFHDPNSEDAIRDHCRRVAFTRADLIREVSKKSFVVAWRGYQVYEDDAFEMANRIAYAAEDCTVVMEELDTFSSAGDKPIWAYRLVHVGRHRGCRVMMTARCPYDIPRKLTRNVTRIMAGRTPEPRDVDYIRKYVGAPDLVARLPDLPNWEFLDWQRDGVAALKKSPFS